MHNIYRFNPMDGVNDSEDLGDNHYSSECRGWCAYLHRLKDFSDG